MKKSGYITVETLCPDFFMFHKICDYKYIDSIVKC
jgi:hypothetical protein